MKNSLVFDKEYRDWLANIKDKVRRTQIKAAVKVNTTLLSFYWDLGSDIVKKQAHAKWGEGFLLQLSKDLTSEFPGIKGFSRRNLELVRQWYIFYSKGMAIAKQPVSQLDQISIVQQPVKSG